MKNIGKMTKRKYAQLQSDHKSHNAFLKSIGEKPVDFDAYITYAFGYNKPKANNKNEYTFGGSTAYALRGKVNAHYPSVTSAGQGAITRSTPKIYTGSLIKGISTLHKSNAVPVISEAEMHEHAAMRR